MKKSILYQTIGYALFIVCCAAFALAFFSLTGCSQVRMAPSEAQKQLAWQTHLNARAVNSDGATAQSPATRQIVEGTAVSLAYTGLPASPEINDLDAVTAQAKTDATERITGDAVFDSVDEGLGLGLELAALFGFGGVAVGGKKVLEWIKLAREKNQALSEVVRGNEILKQYLQATDQPGALEAFKAAQQQAQKSDSTTQLVALERLASKAAATAVMPAVKPAATVNN